MKYQVWISPMGRLSGFTPVDRKDKRNDIFLKYNCEVFTTFEAASIEEARACYKKIYRKFYKEIKDV